MIEEMEDSAANRKLVPIILVLVATDLSVLLDIPFLRQIFGFIFLTFIPGFLILYLLKLNKLDFTTNFVLSVGCSISFLMFYGLLINSSLPYLGCETPLSTVPLLISLNIAVIILIFIAYRMDKNVVFSLPKFNLSTSEKAVLIIPILFPALSIFGMHIMNTTDNNIILMFMLFLIPVYVVFVCFFNKKFSTRLYPVVIFLISISLLLMISLRSNHIIGIDTHEEYYLFLTTLNNHHWRVFVMGDALDACLSISLLPTVYQSVLNVSAEFLFKILYSLIFSVSPLVIYIISKKYIGDFYGFLASCFFMFQSSFLWTGLHARTNTAILFLALAMMVIFNEKIDTLKKRLLFIVFVTSCMVSHYSTTFIFLFVMLGTFLGIELLSKRYTFKKVISLTFVILFFALIFLWYSQVTETAFYSGVRFVETTLSNLNIFFEEEMRSESAQILLGEGFMELGIPQKIEFILTWLTFVFIAIGVITLIIRNKEMSFPELKFKKPDFLKDKFEVTYFVIALVLSGLLVATVALPYVTVGYSLARQYSLAITILSVFFVIGGIVLSKQTFKKSLIKNLSFKKKTCAKRKSICEETVNGEHASKGRAYLIILMVLIPYFLCVTGVTCQVFGHPRTIILNSNGPEYDQFYIHDQESYGAKWLKEHYDGKSKVYTDFYGKGQLQSQSGFPFKLIDRSSLINHKEISGYIYLVHRNVINGKLMDSDGTLYNITEYEDAFVARGVIYNSSGSEIWK